MNEIRYKTELFLEVVFLRNYLSNKNKRLILDSLFVLLPSTYQNDSTYLCCETKGKLNIVKRLG